MKKARVCLISQLPWKELSCCRSVKIGVQHLRIIVDTKESKPVGTAGSQALTDICGQKKPFVFLYESLALGRAGHKMMVLKKVLPKTSLRMQGVFSSTSKHVQADCTSRMNFSAGKHAALHSRSV